jgi:dihydrofolate synthase/folylpolyglutamate synthase
MPKHTYEAAEKFILSREFFGMKLGLENITDFLIQLNSPQNNYHTIHISGTNGKGSTAAMLASVLHEQGYKTGLFTSPHLVSLRERVKVNGRKISRPSVSLFIDRNRKLLTKRKLSFFELITAMALDYFSRCKVDIAIIETGLGGRLDASNVLNPLLTITTDISYDHVEILGQSITKIANEKAGIVKPGTPHLIGLLPNQAVNVFERKAKRIKSPLIKLSKKDFKFDLFKMSCDFRSNGMNITDLRPSLLGIHQLKNSVLAMKAVSVLRNLGYKVSQKAIINGLKSTVWHGRFQVVNYKWKPDHVFDVSHNTAGIKAFVDSFKLLYPNKKAYIITGFVKRKEHQKIFNYLSEIAHSYSLVPLSTRRSTDIKELIDKIDFKNIPYKKYNSLEKAYSKLLKMSQFDDIIIIIGSHYLVGEFFGKYHIK